MLAVKYSDGSFYPVWWIVDVLQNTDIPPQGYVLMTEVAFDQWTIDNKSAMDTWLIDNILIPKAKISKYEYIDENTGELISNGFTYGGKQYSLSTNAQINWSNLLNIPDGMFPLPIMSMLEQVFMLPLSERQAFYLTALNGKNIHLQSGSVLKGQIKAMTDLTTIENFVDPRV